jgi:hypothetical protein
MLTWRLAAGDHLAVAAAATVLLLALPGILGPNAVIPVGVDLPATAVILWAGAAWAHDWHVVAIVLVALAATIKETAPVFAALWLWTPWPLLALTVPSIAALVRPSGPDPLGPQFDRIAAQPVRTALEAHRGRWRDAWLMVAPWGACLAALYQPDWRIVAVLAIASAQLLVATDTVRLVHHAAGPALAAAAAATIPTAWLPLVLVAHTFWWRTPERV